MQEDTAGEWFVSNTRFGPMVYAKLGIAQENSGKLVSLVRQKAQELAGRSNAQWVIVDGAPGIGCPVIASISGIDFALVVTEPTLSGLHDAKRVIDVARHFKTPVKIVINKFDLNPNMAVQIERYARENGVHLLGKICFDKSVVQAMSEGKTIIEYPGAKARGQVIAIWQKIESELK